MGKKKREYIVIGRQMERSGEKFINTSCKRRRNKCGKIKGGKK